MSSKIKVDTIENVAGSGNVSLGSGHNLVVPGNNTTSGNATVGGTLGVTGAITGTSQTLTKSGNVVLSLNRTGSGTDDDGDIVQISNADGLVGAIGSSSNTEITFAGKDCGLGVLDHALVPTQGDGLLYRNDNEVDLGRTDTRFKDIYISGGLYVGGTDAAHQFHDYEEGDRASSSVSGITASTNTVTGHYTKIGRQVVEHIKVVISGKSGGSGNPYIGLSFTPTKTIGTSVMQGGSIGMNTVISSSTFLNTGFMGVYGGNPQVYANDYQQGYYSSGSWGNGTLAFTVIYEAD